MRCHECFFKVRGRNLVKVILKSSTHDSKEMKCEERTKGRSFYIASGKVEVYISGGEKYNRGIEEERKNGGRKQQRGTILFFSQYKQAKERPEKKNKTKVGRTNWR